jgi:phosphatidylinositol-4,5-bisphosphate 4-phosphatase
MEGFLKGQGIEGHRFKDLAGQIENGYREGVEKQPWIRVTRDIPISVGNSQIVLYENTLIPAREISGELAQSYRGLEGVSSLSNAEPNHPVNMWKTTFRPALGQFSFSGIRHGVHDAFKIKDRAERVAAADRKVAEFIQASVQSAPPESLKKNADGSYDFTIMSASVLTPSSLNGEAAMLQHQLDAYKRANDSAAGLQIQIKNAQDEPETVTVHPKIIGFNTGVNSWALSRSPLKAFTSIFSWSVSNEANDRGFEQLLGDIRPGQPVGGLTREAVERLNAKIADPATSPADRVVAQRKLSTINQLVSQIREIVTASGQSSTSYRQIGKEPYKLPVRLLALANEIGATPAFNCKSGKDRTGQLDVEVKDFYTYLNAHNGEVRPINYVRSDTEVDNFKKLFELGGAREIQKFNTGVPGSKVELSMFYDLLGYEKNTVDNLKGLSKWVGS